MKHLKNLMLTMPYLERVPDQSIIVGKNGERYNRLLATRGNDYLMVYNYHCVPMKIDLRKVSGAKKNVWWMDAATGSLEYIGEFDSRVVTFAPQKGVRGISDGVFIAIDSSKHYLAKDQKQIADMIADAIHSLTDFVTDVIVLVFVKLGNKPMDRDHDYGHGKYETLATAIIGISLFAVGMMICWSGLVKTYHAFLGEELQQPGIVALVAAVASVALKEWAYQFTVRTGRKYHSEAVVANAWHHRSDALSSIGTMMGIGGAILLGSHWAVLDPLAAIVVSIFIIKASWSLVMQSVKELTDASLSDAEEADIVKTAAEVQGVCEIHNLRTRRIGNKIAIEMHVRMPGSLSLYVAHERATAIEQRLKQKYGADTHVGIHLEPIKINGRYQAPE